MLNLLTIELFVISKYSYFSCHKDTKILLDYQTFQPLFYKKKGSSIELPFSAFFTKLML